MMKSFTHIEKLDLVFIGNDVIWLADVANYETKVLSKRP